MSPARPHLVRIVTSDSCRACGVPAADCMRHYRRPGFGRCCRACKHPLPRERFIERAPQRGGRQ